MALTSIQPASANDLEPAFKAGTDPYLELSVTPSVVAPGGLVTLYITYHNIGIPFLYLNISPCENVAFDPLISDPCDNTAHLEGPSEITFRALKTGVVTFHAGATGEIFDEACHCWVMSVAGDNGPAILHIVDQVWTVFLPVIPR
jgi:hypothetical protein